MIVLILFITLIVIALGIFIFKKIKQKTKETTSNVVKQIKKRNEPIEKYLDPEEFFVGQIPMTTYKSSNLCNDKVLYPINGIDVDYGSKMPSNCPMYEFIQPP